VFLKHKTVTGNSRIKNLLGETDVFLNESCIKRFERSWCSVHPGSCPAASTK